MNVLHLNVICKPGVYGGPGTGAPLVIFGMGFLPFPDEPQPESVSQRALKSLLKPLRFSYEMWMFGT